jgi:hypothetical protein
MFGRRSSATRIRWTPTRSCAHRGSQHESRFGGNPLVRAAHAQAAALSRQFIAEPLENRRMLIVLAGGGMNGNQPQETTFEYVDQAMNNIRIALWGDVEVAAVFAQVGTDDAYINLCNPLLPSAAGYPNATSVTGTDLFELYILHATPGASIAIAQVPDISTTPTPRPMEPTAGTVGSIRDYSNTSGENTLISAPGGTGAVYIGTRLVPPGTGTDLISETPILSIDSGEISKIPDPSGLTGNPLAGLPTPKNGKVLAGIFSAAGVSLNRLYIGGTITGDVNITGSVEDFYAGNIWTGMEPVSDITAGLPPQPGAPTPVFEAPHVALGESFNNNDPPTGTVLADLVRNFQVGDDLEQLDVSGAIGTDATVAVSGTSGPEDPNLNTGFSMYVGGHLGSIDCRNSIVGTIHVANPKSHPNKGYSQTKVALVGQPINQTGNNVESFFEGNVTGLDGGNESGAAGDFGAYGVPSLSDPSLLTLFGNGSPTQAQYLGTPYDASTGFNTAVVDGVLGATGTSATDGADDYVDWYAVSLLAGQTVDATLTTPDLALNPSLSAWVQNNFGGMSATTIQNDLQKDLTNLRFAVFSPQVQNTDSQDTTVPSGGTNGVATGFNPIGMVASNYSNDLLDVEDSIPSDSLQFTAQQPGTYYIAIGVDGDVNFNGSVDNASGDIEGVNEPNFENTYGFTAYELQLTGVGNLGIGAVEATQSIANVFPMEPGEAADTTAIRVDAGDLGAVTCPSTENLSGVGTGTDPTAVTGPGGGPGLICNAAGAGNEYYVNDGNLRDVDGQGIGVTHANTVGVATSRVDSALTFDVPDGSVGLIRTTDPTIEMFFNDAAFAPNSATPAAAVPIVGGDYQMIDCAGNLEANVRAAKSIGVVRAAEIGNLYGSGAQCSFQINATGKPEGGVIDLIDDTGQWGNNLNGGPAIVDGPGGNVRYLTIGGSIFQDPFFGSYASPQLPINYPAGQAVTLIDDSGTRFTITPVQKKTIFDQTTGTEVTGDPGGIVSTLTYPVRDSGGVVLVKATIGDAMEPTQASAQLGTSVEMGGVTVTANAAGRNGSVEIGDLVVEGTGTDTVFNPYVKDNFTTGTNDEPLSATFTGNVPVSVWDLSAVSPTSTATFSGFASITNNTSGEMPNVEASSIGTFTAQTIGLAKSDTGGNFVGGYDLSTNTFPFGQQRNLIAITGDAQNIEARSGLGNILVGGTPGTTTVGTGTIGTLEADTADQFATTGSQTFPGIDAPVLAQSTAQAPALVPILFSSGTAANLGTYSTAPEGNILYADVGQGLLSGGTGDHPASGLFASNYIGTVTNQGAGSDIHGPIVADAVSDGLETTHTEIDPTLLTPVVGSEPGTATAINSIDLVDGAIIGGSVMVGPFTDALVASPPRTFIGFDDPQTTLPANAIGSISSTGRYAGFLEADIGADNIGSITTSGGFGMVDSIVEQPPGSDLGTLSADGYGIRDSDFDGGQSTTAIDAVGNGSLVDVRRINPAARQSASGVTYDPFSGEQLNAGNDVDLDFQITTAKPKRVGESESGVIADSLFTGGTSLGTLNAWRLGEPGNEATANRISFGLGINSINVGNSMYYTAITTGGIPNLNVKDQMFDSSLIVAGPIGTVNIDDFKANSSITTNGPDGTIGTVNIGNIFGGDLNSSVSVGKLIVNGNFTSPDVYDAGAFNTIDVGGSVAAGSSITVGGTLTEFEVKKNFAGFLQAKVITHKAILGHNTGTIIVTG